ncbi:Zn-dependent hydrolase [Pseudalkalibacillus sp. JSM 102089]|uniref:Zn-dependent hydrolase n=1 Tax=Pseudalkalibacillus sp. JSM 102089 TaxID=3229856 RepID=UPI0035241E7D
MHSISKGRVKRILDAINAIGYTKNGMERLAFTKEEQEVKNLFIKLCLEENMEVRVDEVGNVIARREGVRKNAPAVAIGSHLDTVYTGGQYDGVAGVVAGLEVIHRLNDYHIETEFPIEVIAFTGEESARFGISTIGSKAMCGKLPLSSLHTYKDKSGVTLTDAMQQAGLKLNDVPKAKRIQSELKAFIELHIEQGPELEIKRKSVAIATGIAAPTRFAISVNGMSSHSGATSMELRNDALVAASHLVLTVEEAARKESASKTVATVGVLDVFPGAMNVVPGRVEFQVDIRGLNRQSKERIVEALFRSSAVLEKNRGVTIRIEKLSDEQPVLLNKEIQQMLALSCEEVSIDPLSIPSGAGHDAMNMAELCPTGLMFIPSHKGISHHPLEYTSIDDLIKGINVLEKVIRRLAMVKERNVAT